MVTEVTNLKDIEPILHKYFKGYILSNDPFEKVLIYTKEKIIAVISYSIIYERGEINYIITLPNYRKKGIASKLLEYALNDMKNCENISLEVSKDNKEAINLYSKYGFKIKTDRKKYYDGKDAYLMVR